MIPAPPPGLSQQERLARLALHLGLNSNPGNFHRVMRQTGSAEQAFDGRDLRVLGVNLTPLLTAGLFEEAQEKFDQSHRSGYQVVVWGDENYPLRLTEMVDPPPVIWVQGSLETSDKFAVAMVGSRDASPTGLNSARRLAREGAQAGLVIISGLAKGVDAQAHLGALEAGGRTLAVLGHGLNWTYPKENAWLFREIITKGALISEFPPEVKPLPANFPRRNRIIAGLSLAVVVVEASQRSGSLITARLGLEMNREVMALPGLAGAAKSQGTNSLIKNGAALVENIADVLVEIKPRLLEGLTALTASPNLPDLPTPEMGGPPPALPAPPVATRPDRVGVTTQGQGPPVNKTGAQAETFAPQSQESLILANLESGPKDVDSLIRAIGLDPAEITLLLLKLELAGLISRRDSGCYDKA